MKEDICPECNSNDIRSERQMEYTGGGYALYWYENECRNCGNTWQTDFEQGYA